MECENILEKVRLHAVVRTQSVGTPRGCRISLPLLEPSGDVISVTVVQDGGSSGTYHVTDGGRLSGLLFESGPVGGSAADQRLVRSIADRATLSFDREHGVYYAPADDQSLGYWAFEVGRTIALAASMIPQQRRHRTGARLSTYVLRQLEQELREQGLRNLVRGSHIERGVMDIEHRVDLSYRTSREPLESRSPARDVLVIATDLGTADPKKPTRAVAAAQDLRARDGEPIVRIVHGIVAEAEAKQTEPARRLIEAVASIAGIEQFSWDDATSKERFVAVTRDELSRGAPLEESISPLARQ